MQNTNMLTTTGGNDQFYPTPPELVQKMLTGINFDEVKTVLEPSSGKGDIVRGVLERGNEYREIDVDCIEIDPNLRGILNYTFGNQRKREVNKRLDALNSKSYYSHEARERMDGLTPNERTELRDLLTERRLLNKGSVHVIHDDFLTYLGYKRYDLIIMNPPFANGEKHLLKALEIQRHGGTIICLINGETIRNAYSRQRKELVDKLTNYGAAISFINNGFMNAERKTDVEIALIKVNIPREVRESEIFEGMRKAKHERIEAGEVTDLVAGDWLDQSLTTYQVEIESTLKFIQMYQELYPYMNRSFDDSFRGSAILSLTVGTDSNHLQECDVNEYLKRVRLKYWRALFERDEFTGKFTSKLREKYRELIEELGDYDFTRFNIQKIFIEMNAEMIDGVKGTIMGLFDKLSQDHSLHEGSGNVHYFDGWKTNKAHKVNKKVIIPAYGIVGDYSWSKVFDRSNAYNLLSDLEKAFNYLDGGITTDVNLGDVLDAALKNGQRSKIQCKYFEVDMYKKGTVHIRFSNMELLNKLNIYAARSRNWLPPNYGKVHYDKMSIEEQSVVDSFQGKAAYAETVARCAYYLAEPTRELPALMSATH